MGIFDSLSCPPLGSIVPGARAPHGHVLVEVVVVVVVVVEVVVVVVALETTKNYIMKDVNRQLASV